LLQDLNERDSDGREEIDHDIANYYSDSCWTAFCMDPYRAADKRVLDNI
jgi:hypothetical protein